MKYNGRNGGLKIPTLAFEKAVFYTIEMCGNILNIFWGGIRSTKFLYKNNKETWRYIFLLEIVRCDRLCLVLIIHDIVLT